MHHQTISFGAFDPEAEQSRNVNSARKSRKTEVFDSLLRMFLFCVYMKVKWYISYFFWFEDTFFNTFIFTKAIIIAWWNGGCVSHDPFRSTEERPRLRRERRGRCRLRLEVSAVIWLGVFFWVFCRDKIRYAAGWYGCCEERLLSVASPDWLDWPVTCSLGSCLRAIKQHNCNHELATSKEKSYRKCSCTHANPEWLTIRFQLHLANQKQFERLFLKNYDL